MLALFYFTHVTHLSLLKPCEASATMIVILLRRNWSTEGVSNFPKVTQQINGRAGVGTQGFGSRVRGRPTALKSLESDSSKLP